MACIETGVYSDSVSGLRVFWIGDCKVAGFLRLGVSDFYLTRLCVQD